MKRPFANKRLLGPFAQLSGDSLEPDKWLIFDFEGEEWMIENREMHKTELQSRLRKPEGATGEVIIRIKEKEWDNRELVNEYEDEFPVTMVQIGMIDVIRFDEALADVISIVEEYIHEQGGEFSESYTTDI